MKRSSWRRTQRWKRRQLDWLVTHRFAVKSLKSLCCLGRLNLLSCVPLRPHSHLCGSSYTALPASASVSQFLSFSFSYENSFGERKMSSWSQSKSSEKMLWIWMRDLPRTPFSLLLLLCLLLTLSLSVSVCLSVLGFMRCTCIGSQV